MTRISRIADIIVPFAVLAVWIIACSQSRPPSASEPATHVSAEALFRDYETNEIAADQKYKEAVLQVGGTIEDIGKDLIGTPYVTLSASEFFNVQAMFPTSAEKDLAALRKGADIKVRCRGAGKLGNVILRECALVK
jgi:hypothetical protein